MTTLSDFYIPPMVYGRKPTDPVERAETNACFIYIPLANESRLRIPADILDGIGHEPTPQSLFHLTLLMATDCPDESLTAFMANINPPIRFSIEVAKLGILQGLSNPVLVWLVNADPALIGLHASLHNQAMKEGLVISQYSDPGIFIPHITVAYDLERDPGDLPQVSPFRMMVDSFIVGRENYERAFQVYLPRTGTDGPLIARIDQVIKHGDHIGQQGLPGGGSQPGYTHAEGSVEGEAGAPGEMSGEDWYHWQDETIEHLPKLMGRRPEEGYRYEPGRWLGLHSEGAGDVFRELALRLDSIHGPSWSYIEEKLRRIERDLDNPVDARIFLFDRLSPNDNEIRKQQLELWRNAPQPMPGPLKLAQLLNINVLERQRLRIMLSIQDIRNLKTQTEVTRSEMARLLNGGGVVRGAMRRVLTLEDGPFKIVQEHYAEIHPGTGTDQSVHAGDGGGKPGAGEPGMKRKETGFEGAKQKLFGKLHHRPVAIDTVPDSEDFAELIDLRDQWEGKAEQVVEGLIEDGTEAIDPFTDEDLRTTVSEEITAELVQEQIDQWYDAKMVGREGFPLTAEEMVGMTNEEIHQRLVESATQGIGEIEDWQIDNRVSEIENIQVGTIKNQDAEGRPRTYLFGRDGEEITGALMATDWSEDDYRIGSFEHHAKKYASYEIADQRNPLFKPENYEDEDFESGFLHVNWLAAKRKGAGYGSTMMGEAFKTAAEKGWGLVLEADVNANGFYEKMGGNYVGYHNMYFWPADQVADLASRAEEESVALIGQSLILREDLDQILFGADEGDESLRLDQEEEDFEPKDGSFVVAELDWSLEPRNWRKLFAEQIAEAEYMTDEDAAVLDANKPYDASKPDDREKMLTGVQRSLENLTNKMLSFALQQRHLGPGPHPSGTGQEVHGHRDGEAEDSAEELGDGGRIAGFKRIVKILKRILKGKMDIEENPEDVSEIFGELENNVWEWEGKAKGILSSWLDDLRSSVGQPAYGEYEEEGEIDYERYSEMEWELAEEWAQEQVHSVIEAYDADTDIWFEENAANWEELGKKLGLTDEQMISMGNQEILDLATDKIAMEILVDRHYYEQGEFESVYDITHTPEQASSDAIFRRDQKVAEIVNEVSWAHEMQWARENISEHDVEQHFGSLPRLEPDEPFEVEPGLVSYSPNHYFFVGRSEGEIVSVMEAQLRDRAMRDYEVKSMIEAGRHKIMGLSVEEFEDAADDPVVYLGLLASKRHGAGFGTEMILQGLRLAAENNAGILGDSVSSASTFYDKLGARWLHESGPEAGGTAFFTAQDVANAVKWMKMAGIEMGFDITPQAELEEESLVMRFNVWALADMEPEEESAAMIHRRDRWWWQDEIDNRNDKRLEFIEELRNKGILESERRMILRRFISQDSMIGKALDGITQLLTKKQEPAIINVHPPPIALEIEAPPAPDVHVEVRPHIEIAAQPVDVHVDVQMPELIETDVIERDEEGFIKRIVRVFRQGIGRPAEEPSSQIRDIARQSVGLDKDQDD